MRLNQILAAGLCLASLATAFEAKADITLVRCTAPTKGLVLLIPFVEGGVNPIVGTVRLMKGKRTLLETTNEDVMDYENTVDRISFDVVNQKEVVQMKTNLMFNPQRGRYVGSIRYGGMLIGMVCSAE